MKGKYYEFRKYQAPSDYSMQYDNELEEYEEHFGLLNEPDKCGVTRGIKWFSYAFTIFKDNLLTWLAISVIYGIIISVLDLRFVLKIIAFFVMFHFTAGFIFVSALQEEGEQPNIGDMFAGFRHKFVPLLLLTLLEIVFIIIISFIAGFALSMIISGLDIMSIMREALQMQKVFSGYIIFLLLIMMIPFIVLLMALWHAPALIMLHDISPFQAMKMSFKGYLRNMLPFTLLGLLMVVFIIMLIILAIFINLLTVSLGFSGSDFIFWLMSPLFAIMTYTSYRDIWTHVMIDEE